jgi:hypothetical protein
MDISSLSAINSATLERVQTVLREICAQNPQAFELASAKLLVPNRDDAKRKRDSTHQQRYEICVQCEEEYDVLDNEQGACEWHPGTPKFLDLHLHCACRSFIPFVHWFDFDEPCS